MMNPTVTCVVDCQDKLGEGAIWCPWEQALWWVDVPSPAKLHRYDPATGKHDSWGVDEMVMSIAKRRDGTLIVASHHGLNIFDPATGVLKRVAAPEAAIPQNRSNDGGTDAVGRFWFGTMTNNIASDNTYLDTRGATGVLYKVEADFRITPVMGEIGIFNAVCWSPDSRTMYFADTLIDEIHACDFDLALGAISNKRVFAAPKGHGYPDGATVDEEGYVWNARWEGSCVIRFTPDGTIDRIIEIPASRVTSCAFGGPDLSTLYITTSRLHLTAEDLKSQPQAGGVFSCRPGVCGIARPQFAG